MVGVHELIDSYSQLTENVEKFVFPDEDLRKLTLVSTETLFSTAKLSEPYKLIPIEKLHTEDFEIEQVWEQIQLLNHSFSKYLESNLNRFLKESDVELDLDVDENEIYEETEDIESESESVEDEVGSYGSEDEEETEERESVSFPEPSKEKTEVDDEFFSVRQMEAFAEMAETYDTNRNQKSFDDENLRELFDIGDLGAEDMENANDIYYDDFFGSKAPRHLRENENVKVNRKRKAQESESDHDSYDDEPEIPENDEDESNPEISDEDDVLELDDISEKSDSDQAKGTAHLFNDSEAEDEINLSTFEKKQKQMENIVKQLEEEAVSTKPWVLKGEASAKSRPVNSLLEEDLEAEFNKRPAPVITEETTSSLEDLIKSRIKDGSFNDVERKVAHLQKAYDPNKRVELMDEKSNKSLAQVYEEEYLRQVQGSTFKSEKQEKLDKEHVEIELLFKNLCQSLDGLSNWNFTPKPLQADLEIIPNASVPAISMEEAIPTAINSTSATLAPQEIYDGSIKKGVRELTSTEKRRERAKKKKMYKKHKPDKKKDVEKSI